MDGWSLGPALVLRPLHLPPLWAPRVPAKWESCDWQAPMTSGVIARLLDLRGEVSTPGRISNIKMATIGYVIVLMTKIQGRIQDFGKVGRGGSGPDNC